MCIRDSQSAVDDAEAQKTLATELLGLYSELEKKDVKTDTDLTLMADYAAQIAELYPQLGAYIDPATGLFTENTDAILDNINAMAQLAMVQGYQEYLSNLGTELAEANIQIAEHTRSLEEQAAELERLAATRDGIQELYDTLYENQDGTGGVEGFKANLTEVYTILQNMGEQNPLSGLVDVLSDGTVVLREGTDAAAAYEAAQAQLSATLGDTDDKIAVLTTLYDNNTQALSDMQAEADGTRQQMQNITATIAEEQAAYESMTQAAADASTAGTQAGEDIAAAGDAAEGGAEKIQAAADQLEGTDETASSTAEGVATAGTSIATTAEQIAATTEDLVAAQNTASNAQASVDASTSDISEAAQAAQEDMETSAADIIETATEAYETVAEILASTVGAQIGNDFMDGLRTAISNGKTLLSNTAKLTAKSAHDAASLEMSQAKGQTIGNALVQGIQAGINAQRSNAISAARSVGSGASSALWDVVGDNGSNFRSIGSAIASGVAQGIRNGSGRIKEAAREAAWDAYIAAKLELEIESPSKVMTEVGEDYDEGFAQGIERGMGSVLRSARRLSAMAAEETAQGGRAYPSISAPAIDYDRLGDAVADSFIRKGIDRTVITMDGRTVGQTVEPSVSRASYLRGQTNVKGRAARLVLA